MDKVVVYYHSGSDTLDIWFGNPKDESSCEEVGDGVILKKDREGNLIGFEKLYVHQRMKLPSGKKPLPIEVVVS